MFAAMPRFNRHAVIAMLHDEAVPSGIVIPVVFRHLHGTASRDAQ
jgi:hypothetical protein